MRNIFLVTFRSKKYGEGHFVRLNRIAKSLQKNNKLYLVVNNPLRIDQLSRKIYKKIFDVSDNEHLNFIKKNLSKNDLIWFDLPEEKNSIKSMYVSLSANLIAINMFGAKQNALEKLSFFPKYDETRRVIKNGTTEISGTKCLILPSDLFNSKIKKEKQIIVSMGGGDPMEFTTMLLPMLLNLNVSGYKIKIILPRHLTRHDFKNFDYGNISLFEFGMSNFCEELKKSSLAIINGGMTRYECVAAKTPFIALSIHEKQFEISAQVTKFGLGFNFGVLTPQKLNSLKQYIEKNYIWADYPRDDTYPMIKSGSSDWMYRSALDELGIE